MLAAFRNLEVWTIPAQTVRIYIAISATGARAFVTGRMTRSETCRVR